MSLCLIVRKHTCNKICGQTVAPSLRQTGDRIRVLADIQLCFVGVNTNSSFPGDRRQHWSIASPFPRQSGLGTLMLAPSRWVSRFTLFHHALFCILTLNLSRWKRQFSFSFFFFSHHTAPPLLPVRYAQQRTVDFFFFFPHTWNVHFRCAFSF